MILNAIVNILEKMRYYFEYDMNSSDITYHNKIVMSNHFIVHSKKIFEIMRVCKLLES